MSDYATTSTPIRPRNAAVSRLSVIQRRIPVRGQPSARCLPGHPRIFCLPRLALRGKIFADRQDYILRGGAGIFRDQLPVLLFGVDRFLPPFFGIESFVFPSFLNPQNSFLTQPIYGFSTTYNPKFPYALQYNLNLEQEIAPGTILRRADFVGCARQSPPARLTRTLSQPALGHRYNPNLPSPLDNGANRCTVFLIIHSRRPSLKQYAHNLSPGSCSTRGPIP